MNKEEIESKKYIGERLRLSDMKRWDSFSESERQSLVDICYDQSDIEKIGLHSVLQENKNLTVNFGFMFMGLGLAIISQLFLDSVVDLYPIYNPINNIFIIIFAVIFFTVLLRKIDNLSGYHLKSYSVIDYLLKQRNKSEYGHPATEKATFLIRCRAVIVSGDKILAVKHFEGAKYYALPGGHMEAGEDPMTCIKREIKEELDIDIQNPVLKYIYNWRGESGDENVEFVFLVRDSVNEADIDMKTSSHAFEIFEARWIGRNESVEDVVYPKAAFKDFQENNFEFDGVKFVRE